MSQRSADQSSGIPESATLRIIVERYQTVYSLWYNAATQHERDVYNKQLHEIQEVLWLEIQYPLRQVAKGWMRSWEMHDLRAHLVNSNGNISSLDSFAMSLYLLIIEELPRLQIDPSKNLESCIKEIVRHRLLDRQRKVRREHGHTAQLDDQPLGSSSAKQWISDIRDRNIYYDDDQRGIVDPNSYDADTTWIERLYQRDIWDVVFSYWQHVLDSQDYLIMQRWKDTPPTPFRAIAQQLGPGWSEGMVRQRHFRILNRTKHYLVDRGLFD